MNATGGALKPEKCCWYLLDYNCVEGEWIYVDATAKELEITNPDGTTSPIKQEKVTESKKTLGIYDSPSGGNEGHLKSILGKASQWVNRMINGHLSSHIAWVVYKHQLWPSLRYGLGTMTNNMDVEEKLLNKTDYKTLNVLGIFQNVYTGLRKLHTTFWRIWTIQPPNGTNHQQSQHALSALSRLHESKLETGRITSVSTTPTRNTTQSINA